MKAKLPLLTIHVLLGTTFLGCSARGVAEQHARTLALYTNSVRREADRFSRYRDAIAKARTQNMNLLEESALGAEQELAAEVQIWRLIRDRARLDLYEGIVAATELAQAQQRKMAQQKAEHERLLQSMKGRVAIRTDKLAATSKALAKLAEKPDFKEDLKFYFGFFQEVKGQLDSLRNTARQLCEQANEEAAAISDERPDPNTGSEQPCQVSPDEP
jgi:hypothetical protein